jgi:putative membrane-bound dehydrogenase-like protein
MFRVDRRLPIQLALSALVAACCALFGLPPSTADEPSSEPKQAAAAGTGIRAPDGFEVSLYAGDDLAHDIYSMTLDSQGRVVVAGQGYVKTLLDDDGDGVADRAKQFSDRPKSGAHGMLFLGSDLLCTGDDSLMLLRDSDADGQADGEPEIWAKVRSPEHGANGLTRGPDGWIYLICGNDAGVGASLATEPGSPVKQPQCGAVVRFSPDGNRSEVVAHGFRNPYDLDFNADGRLFTVDADGERDHHLPWYAPTRLFDIAPGMHHGWVLQGWQRSWNRPEWMFDNVPRAAEIGRGSPTGLAVYRHHQFPSHYQGSVLTCCWTLGRVYCLPLSANGSSYKTEPEVFLETTGEVGFAPVDLAVGKSGELFVAIGGRRTRGSVFKVRYLDPHAPPKPSSPTEPTNGVAAVLQAPQPQAAWSRSIWEPAARAVGAEGIADALMDSSQAPEDRVRAVEILTDLFDGVQPSMVNSLLTEASTDSVDGVTRVAARGVWSLGRGKPTVDRVAAIATATHSKHPTIQRSAWEGLAALAEVEGENRESLGAADWKTGLNSPDRRVRAAALLADARHNSNPVDEEVAKSETDLWQLHFRRKLAANHFDAAAECFLTAADDNARLNAVRLMELALGDIDTHQMQADVYAGYSLNANSALVAESQTKYGSKLAAAFPAKDANLNRELARLLGMLGVNDSTFVDRLSETWTDESTPQDDIHYLIVMSRLPATRSESATQRTAAVLAKLHGKMRRGQMFVSRNWPLRVGEAVSNLYRNDPKLADALVSNSDFAHPSQAMLTEAMTPVQRQIAARKLLQASANSVDEDARWTDELVQLVAELPNNEALPALRAAWDDFTLRDAIVTVLARARQSDDRAKFVEMLGALQPRSVELSAAALTVISGKPEPNELNSAMAALKQACLVPEQQSTRQALAHLLAHWTGESPTIDEHKTTNPLDAYRPWFNWYETTYPELAAAMKEPMGSDGASWQRRLEEIDWDSADVNRGSIVFQKRNCVRCHAGSSPLGPDLAGAAGRFSLADLLTAIVDPHKDVSPLYQTTQIVTGSGRVYNGLVVYESPDSTLLQTAPDTTTRITGDEIVVMRKSKTSLMPSGLLNGISDQELADLFAYLKTLQSKR